MMAAAPPLATRPHQQIPPSYYPAGGEYTYAPIHTFPSVPSQDSKSNSLLSSPRRIATDLTGSIAEDDETESDSANEPITPVSGRQSRDFNAIEHNGIQQLDTQTLHDSAPPQITGHLDVPVPQFANNESDLKPPLLAHAQTAPSRTPSRTPQASLPQPQGTQTWSPAQSDPFQTPQGVKEGESVDERRPSTASQSRSLFPRMIRRIRSTITDAPVQGDPQQPTHNGTAKPNGLASGKVTPSRKNTWRPSFTTTRSNSPPSPSSTVATVEEDGEGATVPGSDDFFENNQRKNRASTTLSQMFRGRGITFATGPNKNQTRRTKSLERKKHGDGDLARAPWAIPPDAGTGMKARRLSLSLPDDFTVDVVELLKEFEYQNKLLGRHGKHLGKGAASKVTLMVRKGSPGELYAVKEFRGKSSSETVQDYEKKIKSEYSIAKSLHHPNIVETIRLCTNHGRWNHVMEYCSEGDLFSLVSKKYLREDGREADRLCLFKQLVQGINYLHSNGIAHRDIKLENLLITKDSKLKITDFGVSEVFCGIHPGLREAGGQCGQGMAEIRLCKPGICGSLPYIAPEVLSKQGDYDPRPLDVWSSAVVMVYLIFGANLWEKAEWGLSSPSQSNYNELVRAWEKYNAKKAANPDLPSEAIPKVRAFDLFVRPIGLRRLLLNMLNPDPEQRITIAEVSNNRWMKNVECCQLESYEDPVKLIDATKKDCMKSSAGKIYCHNHLPPQSTGSGLPPMPGKAGY